MTEERILIGTTELVERIATGTDTPRTSVHLLLDALALIAAHELYQGHRVRIPGIGILEAPETPAREGIGPNGQPYSVPIRRRVRLRPDRSLVRAVEVVFMARLVEGAIQ